MGCSTCGHTTQGIGRTDDGTRHFWCPRCGTLKSEHGSGWKNTESPWVVQRAVAVLSRAATSTMQDDPALRALREAVTGKPD